PAEGGGPCQIQSPCGSILKHNFILGDTGTTDRTVCGWCVRSTSNSTEATCTASSSRTSIKRHVLLKRGGFAYQCNANGSTTASTTTTGSATATATNATLFTRTR